MQKKIKPKACKACGDAFVPFTSTQVACSQQCALKHHREKVAAKEAKAYRKETKRRREAIKPRSKYMKQAQVQFNKYIRARDHLLPCISCGMTEQDLEDKGLYGSKFDCGHYLSVGAHPELRFNEINAHKQCKKCNNQMSGNIANYRKALIEKIGLSLVEWLESNHKPLKPTIDELKFLTKYYTKRAKEAETYMRGREIC